MSDRPEARPRRLVSRYALELAVRVQSATLPSISCQARNVGVGGVFLATDVTPELFSTLAISATLPGAHSAQLGARVVHVLAGQKARQLGVQPGIGVQFDGLTRQDLAFVDALVAWARERDPRPRIARLKRPADTGALQHEPMLGFLLGYLDGKRDPEALAEQLALEVDTIERMLSELSKQGVIELVSAASVRHEQSRSQAPAPVRTSPPTAAGAKSMIKSQQPLSPALQDELSTLESRLKSTDLYGVLGVPPSSSTEQARSAYVTRSAELHPSIRPPAEAQRIERVLGKMREAASVLSSSERKDEYDEYMERAEWLAAAEAMRSRMSIPPPPPGPGDAPPAISLKQPRPPADAAPTRTMGKVSKREPSASARAAAAALRRPSHAPSTGVTQPPSTARPGSEAPPGAASQILAQVEAAYAAGHAAEASRHLRLLSAMTFDDPRVQTRISELKQKVQRAAAVDFEKQAAYEEKQQHWAQAARSWMRVIEGRPNDSYPWQRAALAQLNAGMELREVMETAKRAVEISPSDAQAHRTLAKVYLAADMQASARRELEAAQRCSGESEETPTSALLKRLLGRDDTD